MRVEVRKIFIRVVSTDWQESWSRLDTEVYKTFNLVSFLYEILNHGWSRSLYNLIMRFCLGFSLAWCYILKSCLQGGTRSIFWDETQTEELDVWIFTPRPRLRNSTCWLFEWDKTKMRLSNSFMLRRDLTKNFEWD